MIQIIKLGKSYRGNKVLEDISLNIEEGTIHGIIGASGVGKSTLLRTINSLEAYDLGKIYIEGKNISELTGKSLREFRKNIGMVFQHFSLLNRLTVYENIALPLKCWKYTKSDIDNIVMKLLNTIDLEEKKDEMPRNLSGGQKQRVAIARAISLDPKVLLCDEATSALDPNMTKEISKVLLDINKRLKITIVLVSHDLDMIKEICDNISVLDKKDKIISGSTRDIFIKEPYELRKLINKIESEKTLKVIFKSKESKILFSEIVKKVVFDIDLVDIEKLKLRDEEYFIFKVRIDENTDRLRAYLNSRNIESI